MPKRTKQAGCTGAVSTTHHLHLALSCNCPLKPPPPIPLPPMSHPTDASFLLPSFPSTKVAVTDPNPSSQISKMSSVFQNRSFLFSYFSKNQALPVSSSSSSSSSQPNQAAAEEGLRRRFSSNLSSAAANACSSFRRSKSEPLFIREIGSTGSFLRSWWVRGWGWILSRKPTFARDLEMDEQELSALGSQSRGSWRHLLYRATSQIRRIVGSSPDRAGLPLSCRYNSFDRPQNLSGVRR